MTQTSVTTRWRGAWAGALLASLCVLIPAAAQAQTLTWSAPAVLDGPNGRPAATACASPSLCIVVDSHNDVLVSTNPAGGSGTWTVAKNLPFSPLSTACAPGGPCIVGLGDGELWWSATPADTSSWSGSVISGLSDVESVSCASSTLCVAGDGDGDVAVSTDPTGGAGTWTTTNVVSGSVQGLSCAPGTTQCVGVDDDGNVLWSTTPTNVNDWTVVPAVSPNSDLEAVSCPSAALCLASGPGPTDNVFTATDPTAGVASAWMPATVNGGTEVLRMSCATTSLCVGLDAAGDAVESDDPTGGAGTWSAAHIDASASLAGISCPSARLCLAVDQNSGNGQAILGTVVRHQLAVVLSGAGHGTVTSSPAGISCGSQCLSAFDAGTTVTLTATAASGSEFAGWFGGGCSGTGACVVPMSADTTVTAEFVPPPAGKDALTVKTTGTGNGTVTSRPAGVSCGQQCVADYAPGTGVSLTASARPGSRFTGWSGGGCSGTGACSITLSADVTVSARFALTTHTLKIVEDGQGRGDVTSTPAGIDCGARCSHRFAFGTRLVLFPAAAPGSAFGGWEGSGCTGLQTCRVTLDSNLDLTARFIPAPVKPGPASTNGTTVDQGYSCTAAEPCEVIVTDQCDPPRTCVGAQLDAVRPHPPVALAHGRFRVAARGRRQISLTLTAKGRRLVRAHHRLKVAETITVTTGHTRSVAARTITLTYRRAGH